MPGYRLYCLDRAGGIESADWIEAEDDEAAVELARARGLEASCELWLRNRLVARIPAERKRD